MINIRHEYRYALYDGEQQITDYNWDNCSKDKDYIFLSSNSEIAIYNTTQKGFVAKIPGRLASYNSEYNLIKVKKDKKYGFYSYKGKEILPIIFPWVCDYDEYIGVKDDNNLFGLYSYKGKELVPVLYNNINYDDYYTDNGKLRLVQVEKDNVDGFYDVKNKTFIEAQDINITRTGIIEILKDGRWTFLDK